MHNYAATDNIISFTSTHGMSTEKMNSLVVILISKTSDHDSVTMIVVYSYACACRFRYSIVYLYSHFHYVWSYNSAVLHDKVTEV